MRAVVDPNVVISALIAPHGTPATVLRAWIVGAYDLVVSPLLLAELERALGYPKLRARVTELEAQELIELLGREADVRDDPNRPPAIRSPNPGDDYLVALAEETRAVIVSGDAHLLGLANDLPVYSPAAFLALLDQEGS